MKIKVLKKDELIALINATKGLLAYSSKNEKLYGNKYIGQDAEFIYVSE